MTNQPIDLIKLAGPFRPSDIEFRVGATSEDEARCLALPYITSRAVMDRLDEVCGPANWKNEYRPGPAGGVLCGIAIRLDGEWVTKWDGADNSDYEAVKGGLSDSFKRAAVKWGIGRYLYSMKAVWVACKNGKYIADEDEARRKLFSPKTGKAGKQGSNTKSKAQNPEPETPNLEPVSMSDFWQTAYARGVSQLDGLALLEKVNNDPAKALAQLPAAV